MPGPGRGRGPPPPCPSHGGRHGAPSCAPSLPPPPPRPYSQPGCGRGASCVLPALPALDPPHTCPVPPRSSSSPPDSPPSGPVPPSLLFLPPPPPGLYPRPLPRPPSLLFLPPPTQTWYFECNQWLDSKEGDRRIERLLTASLQVRSREGQGKGADAGVAPPHACMHPFRQACNRTARAGTPAGLCARAGCASKRRAITHWRAHVAGAMPCASYRFRTSGPPLPAHAVQDPRQDQRPVWGGHRRQRLHRPQGRGRGHG